jgi:hypothetical protein
VVVRNGIEIGRCKISIANDKDSIGTFVYVAHEKNDTTNSENGKNVQWMTCELSDIHYGSGNHGDHLNQLKRIKIPDAFLKEIQPLMTEGTTMMITDAPILRKTTGKEMAVISSRPTT